MASARGAAARVRVRGKRGWAGQRMPSSIPSATHTRLHRWHGRRRWSPLPTCVSRVGRRDIVESRCASLRGIVPYTVLNKARGGRDRCGREAPDEVCVCAQTCLPVGGPAAWDDG